MTTKCNYKRPTDYWENAIWSNSSAPIYLGVVHILSYQPNIITLVSFWHRSYVYKWLRSGEGGCKKLFIKLLRNMWTTLYKRNINKSASQYILKELPLSDLFFGTCLPRRIAHILHDEILVVYTIHVQCTLYIVQCRY